MGHPLFYLLGRSFRNRVRSGLRRLRQPKVLIVVLFVLGYLGFSFSLVTLGRGGLREDTAEMPLRIIFPLSVMIITLIAWVSLKKARFHPLGFRVADVQLLFPLPISRRMLVIYRLLTAQPWLLFMSFVLPIGFQAAPSFTPLGILCRWMGMNVAYLHWVIIAFAHGTPRGAGPGRVLFAWLPGILIASWVFGGIALTGISMDRLLGPAWYAEITRIAATDAFVRTLSPFRMLVELGTGRMDPATLPLGFLWGLAALVAHLAWIFVQDNRFEEASVRSAENLASRLEAWKRGEWGALRRRPPRGPVTVQPFRLAPVGHAAWAYLWNGILASGRRYTVRNGLLGVAICGAMGAALRAGTNRLGLEEFEPGKLGIFLAGQIVTMSYFFLILGRRRVEIGVVETMAVLKPLPVTGATVFLGRLLGSVVTTQGLYLLLWSVIVGYSTDLVARAPLQAGGLLLLSYLTLGALVALGHAFNMTLALWIPATASFKVGPEGFVHNLAALLYRLVGMIALLVPVGIAVTLVTLILWETPVVAFASMLTGMVIVSVEVAALVLTGGRLYDRFDLVAEQ